MKIPTARDVVLFLNERFAARGIAFRVQHIDVLPYMNPLWLSNWQVADLDAVPDREIIEEEIAEARWRFPQVLDEEWELNPPSAV